MSDNGILQKKNIRLGCKAMSKEEAIKAMGSILVDSGYVNERYIDAMLERETVFSTNIGNGIAIPHGVEAGKKEVMKSGIGIMVFPEGIDWNGEMVRVVIGIAGVGDEHLDILSKIAETLSEEEEVERVVNSDADQIYQMFT